ncbi:YwaF family protein [Spiroplasma tabanidicola]|uniref:Uncharacterized protein n=1 Tax=Spiroplasma tabanidicola TaxID=324079 RepID=A0A6I6C647_9MOLU|nr:YwaF family protein [Spiroplasma tabanidicola]QGS52397.1 hypothetical protein STABA_v1c10490 [Spiroplasma tabanidicola]
MENLAWAIAIVLAVFMWASLSMFPNYYRNKKVYLTIRIVLVVFLLFTEVQRTVYLGPIHQQNYIENSNPTTYVGQQWYQNPINYFLLYFCTICSYVIIIILIFPNKLLMECFFPFMIMGPVVTFIFPTEKPLFWDSNFLNWFTFFFGHACIMFGALYMYLYGHTEYKFGKQALLKSMLTGLITVTLVEIYNLYFGTDFIVGEVTGAFGLKWPRPWVLVFILSVGNLYLWIGLSLTIFFKPIYKKDKDMKLHNTWWEELIIKIKTKYQNRIKKTN